MSPKLIPAPEIRSAVRDLCQDFLDFDDQMDCYRRIRDHFGLTRSTRERDRQIIASELGKIRRMHESAGRPTLSGKDMKAIRQGLGLTQDQMAEAIGNAGRKSYPKNRISDWECGRLEIPGPVHNLLRYMAKYGLLPEIKHNIQTQKQTE